jgi:hypothetical protein
MTKRRVQIEKDLFFEYEVSPHRSILERISTISGKVPARKPSKQDVHDPADKGSTSGPEVTGTHIFFKQMRSVGYFNPLRPPLDLETVLIGRALGQEVGYHHGVGFRIRDDGYVEGEFSHGVEKFSSFDELVRSVKRGLPKSPKDHKN